MSKPRIGIAVLVLATLVSSPAVARVHLGSLLGPLGGALTHLLPLRGLHHSRSVIHHAHIRGTPPRSQDAGNASNAGLITLENPAQRTEVVAAAALAGWHNGRISNGWWQHRDGEYGWVGPLFWPLAYFDIYDYTIKGASTGFWDYGYPDIYAGIFVPYDQSDLASYTASGPSDRIRYSVPSLQQLCDFGNKNANVPADEIQQAIQPTDAQRPAMDDLVKASIEAARTIQASCPKQPALTAPARLAAMQNRVAAMVQAETVVQPPLEKLYALLDDAQKARLDALAEDRRKGVPAGCDVKSSAALQWPANEIEARLHPNDTQRAALEVLQHATTRAVEMLTYKCQSRDATTPVARLNEMDRRLYDIQQALDLTSGALEDFYATLSDEQKKQFEAIGPQRRA